MKAFLMSIAAEEKEIGEEFMMRAASIFSMEITGDAVKVWRALKALTEGEARKVLTSVKGEDGFIGWQKLHQRFQPGLATREGLLLAEFSGMVARPGKNPGETK
eukprot:7290406-Karenia_brevis.AAC.1